VLSRGWPLRPAWMHRTSRRCASVSRVFSCRRSSCGEALRATVLDGLVSVCLSPGPARLMRWWQRLVCALRPPMMGARSIRVACLVALIAAVVVREKLSTTRILGLLLILAGAVTIVGWHAEGRGTAWSTSRTFGDVLFLIAAFLTACFTLVMRQAKLDPLHAAALVSTGSLVIYLPIYFALYGARLAQIPLADLAAQALFQGVAVTIISLFLYGCESAPKWNPC
jgi:hypothetical protein